MREYHRLFVKGGTYFFTVVTYKRQPLLCEEPALIRLKAAFRYVMDKHPYRMDGLVVLPDHLHCIWQLPENEGNFSIRWNMLKRYFSIGMDSPTNKRREKTIWQRRFWEHLIRDEDDLHRCLDYIHYNEGYCCIQGCIPDLKLLYSGDRTLVGTSLALLCPPYVRVFFSIFFMQKQVSFSVR